MPETESLALTLPIRRLVEFLLRSGSIDSRFTGFDRANEGARIHRKLQRSAVKEHADYAAEVFLRGIFAYEEIEFTLEGRADGIFTAADGVTGGRYYPGFCTGALGTGYCVRSNLCGTA